MLAAAEGVSFRQTVDALKIPRASVRHGMKLLIGALVLSPHCLLLSVGNRPLLDADLRAGRQGEQEVMFDRDGIHVAVDVAKVIDGGSGRVELLYRHALSEDVLATIPATRCYAELKDVGPSLLNGWKGTWSKSNQRDPNRLVG